MWWSMISQVLVALDGSNRAPWVFAAAVEIASRFQAKLNVLRVESLPPEFPAAAAGSRRDPLPAHLVDEATAAVLALIGGTRASHAYVAAPIIRFGQPWRVILDVSEELDVDLIVLGSHGYQGFDRLLGTTAAKVANMARRDVYVVHARSALPVPGTDS